MAVPTILVDTRERTPWTFQKYRVRIKRVALGEADYADRGRNVMIERKTVSDLFHTLTRGEQRFRREMDRMMRTTFTPRHRVFRCILVEGTPRQIVRGCWSSGANGGRVLDHLLRVCVDYGIAPVFTDGRAEAERVAYGLLTGGRV